ncbi:MAG TPA: polysaccharide deacetylase family protein, partial [Chitinophagaceae bacterium]|nr:polysaccharide deacetylase family protein [Chitinophagaceae bacterium]
QDFKKILQKKFPEFVIHRQPVPNPAFFLPTYDIDIAWSYKHKGFWRNAGGFARSLLKGQWSSVKERMRVLLGKEKDPFDAYGWLDKLHEQYNLHPHYFFLVPEKRGRYDKNIPPSSKAMQALIRDHRNRYAIGIHPSWKSGDDVSLLKKEIETLSALDSSRIISSRQHYIRFNLPEGYRRLIENGINYDFSMGYGSINGFRASVASPFYWYDLEKEKKTNLQIYPFCYMEANSFYEQKSTAAQALEEMRYYYRTVNSVNGYFIMIWHNSFLGTDKLSAGWRDIYEQFIKETAV